MPTPRIIAGSAKGIRLKDVPGDITRPVTDIVKGALFNVLGDDILDAALLDLFGGTGSVGIEALSRGASFVRFIDLNRPAVLTIRENLEKTKLTTKAEVVQADAFNYLKRTPDRQFDYLYIAPPQYKKMWEQAIQLVDEHIGWLSNASWVIVQIDPIESTQLSFKNLAFLEERKYGNTLLLFYERII
jgi:16S rRNA (guanine(966)-N(2))-methyltransferase RsmD